jgi:hypothetical protein
LPDGSRRTLADVTARAASMECATLRLPEDTPDCQFVHFDLAEAAEECVVSIERPREREYSVFAEEAVEKWSIR